MSSAAPSREPAAGPGFWGRLREALPQGHTLPDDEFVRRHRALLGLLWFHAAAVPLWGVIQGYGVGHCLLEASLIATPAALATWWRRDRKGAAALVSLGLMTSSALLVHFSHGVIEAHFHFFVMIVLLTLYEDWVPFMIAAGYVVLHHGIGGALDPGSVYNHADAEQHPWKWALIHAGFVSAAGLAAIAAWRLNEDVRVQKEDALARTRQAEAELQRHAERLERSNKDLERFAYVASHDLAEPLRTVSSFVELLQRRYGDQLDETGQEFIRYAVQGTERMHALIQDLLEFARVGRDELTVRSVDTSAVVQDALRDLRKALASAEATVEVGDLPVVAGDVRELGQLFQNLLSNAIKFVDGAPPRVHVGAESGGNGTWTFSVADNGIGIAPGDATKIFEMFRRLHGRDRFDGSGIGLAICQLIVERHGGRIWVEPAPARGSVFRFTLPAGAG